MYMYVHVYACIQICMYMYIVCICVYVCMYVCMYVVVSEEDQEIRGLCGRASAHDLKFLVAEKDFRSLSSVPTADVFVVEI